MRPAEPNELQSFRLRRNSRSSLSTLHSLLLFCASVVEEGVAFEHAVVELPLLLGAAAEGALKLCVGREDEDPPARRQRPDGLAEGAVQSLRLPLFQQPLACFSDQSSNIAPDLLPHMLSFQDSADMFI